MKQVQPDVWETEVQSPFPGLNTHAYLLTRDDGNVLFYNTGHAHEIEKFAQLGGVAHQYLSHEDELGDTLFRGKDNQWCAGFIQSHHNETNRAELADSLRLLATLQPDVVFGSAFTGDYGYEEITDGSWPDKVNHALARLLSSQDS